MVRRILWFLPTLVAVTVLAFAGVSWSFGSASTRPLFFNNSPSDIDTRAWQAAQQVALGDGLTAEAASAELIQIGAAGLPHLLRRLDGLAPQGRYRVAETLMPLATRMGLDPPDELVGMETLRFWRSFWEQHAIDFEPVSVRRLVERYAQRATAGRERELHRLDTAALPELMRQLDKSRHDPEVVARLSAAAAHAAGYHWVNKDMVPGASAEDIALATVRRWQGWWGKNRRGLTDSQGFERLLAPILDTQYADWAREAARTRFGTIRGGEPALQAFTRAAPITILLLAWALIGGPFLALAMCAIEEIASQRLPVARYTGLCLGTAAALTSIFLLSRSADLASQPAQTRIAVATALVAAVGAAMAYRHLRRALVHLQHERWMLTYRLLGLSDQRLFRLTLRHTSGSLVEAMAGASTTIVSGILVAEYGLHIEGLGYRTVEALLARDTTWLMLALLASATLALVIYVVADTLLALVRPAPSSEAL